MAEVKENLQKIQKATDFGAKLLKALESLQPKKQAGLMVDEQKVDELLYDGFVNDADKTKMRAVRTAEPEKLNELTEDFSDERLKHLVPLYKARNYPKSLTQDEKEHWEKFRATRLLSGGENSKAAKYFKRLSELSAVTSGGEGQYLLEELNLYGQAILPGA